MEGHETRKCLRSEETRPEGISLKDRGNTAGIPKTDPMCGVGYEKLKTSAVGKEKKRARGGRVRSSIKRQ